jgi:hypothetical protein
MPVGRFIPKKDLKASPTKDFPPLVSGIFVFTPSCKTAFMILNIQELLTFFNLSVNVLWSVSDIAGCYTADRKRISGNHY